MQNPANNLYLVSKRNRLLSEIKERNNMTFYPGKQYAIFVLPDTVTPCISWYRCAMIGYKMVDKIAGPTRIRIARQMGSWIGAGYHTDPFFVNVEEKHASEYRAMKGTRWWLLPRADISRDNTWHASPFSFLFFFFFKFRTNLAATWPRQADP